MFPKNYRGSTLNSCRGRIDEQGGRADATVNLKEMLLGVKAGRGARTSDPQSEKEKDRKGKETRLDINISITHDHEGVNKPWETHRGE